MKKRFRIYFMLIKLTHALNVMFSLFADLHITWYCECQCFATYNNTHSARWWKLISACNTSSSRTGGSTLNLNYSCGWRQRHTSYFGFGQRDKRENSWPSLSDISGWRRWECLHVCISRKQWQQPPTLQLLLFPLWGFSHFNARACRPCAKRSTKTSSYQRDHCCNLGLMTLRMAVSGLKKHEAICFQCVAFSYIFCFLVKLFFWCHSVSSWPKVLSSNLSFFCNWNILVVIKVHFFGQ